MSRGLGANDRRAHARRKAARALARYPLLIADYLLPSNIDFERGMVVAGRSSPNPVHLVLSAKDNSIAISNPVKTAIEERALLHG